jgi:carotenoid cleavage dioxygenase-like enzyme
MQYHWLGKHEFCSGASFLPRVGGSHEDDGWIISFVHDEKANTSQASFSVAYTSMIPFVVQVIEEINVGIFMFLCYRCI